MRRFLFSSLGLVGAITLSMVASAPSPASASSIVTGALEVRDEFNFPITTLDIGPTPEMTFTAYGVGLSTTVLPEVIEVRPSAATNWTSFVEPLSTCSTSPTAKDQLSDCGILGVYIDGEEVSNPLVYVDADTIPGTFFISSSDGDLFDTPNSAGIVRVELAAGAWSVTGTPATPLFTLWVRGFANALLGWAYTTKRSVLFDPNGGSESRYSQTLDTGALANLVDNRFTRDGFTFAGWNSSADGTGSLYQDGSSFEFLTNTTLYAMWSSPPPAPEPSQDSAPKESDSKSSSESEPEPTPDPVSQPSPETLASTGASVGLWPAASGLALLLGLMLLLARKSRERSARS